MYIYIYIYIYIYTYILPVEEPTFSSAPCFHTHTHTYMNKLHLLIGAVYMLYTYIHFLYIHTYIHKQAALADRCVIPSHSTHTHTHSVTHTHTHTHTRIPSHATHTHTHTHTQEFQTQNKKFTDQRHAKVPSYCAYQDNDGYRLHQVLPIVVS
jgi:hypothetical protein